MGMCPVCNGFRTITPTCPNCSGSMENQGREADYYDDYSPYMPIDQMKLEDGYQADFRDGECPHLYKCAECGSSQVFLVKE